MKSMGPERGRVSGRVGGGGAAQRGMCREGASTLDVYVSRVRLGGVGCDRMGCSEMGWDRTRWNGKVWDGTRKSGMGLGGARCEQMVSERDERVCGNGAGLE